MQAFKILNRNKDVFEHNQLPCNSAKAFTTGFWFCSIFALSNSNISNDEDDPPVNAFPGTDVGAGICPGKLGDGALEEGPEGEVIGLAPGLFLSNLE